MWLEKTFVPAYFSESDYRGQRYHWLDRQYMVDGGSFRVGAARIRQLRMPTQGMLSLLHVASSSPHRHDQNTVPI